MKPYSDDIVSFVYSSDLILTEKPVKTHEKEVYLKSEKYKGFNVGYTQDPVKINNIKDFTSPQGTIIIIIGCISIILTIIII